MNMTDDDEYEGHTPAPWEADLDDEGKRWIDAYNDEGDINLCRITNGNKADAQLMADAPKLWAEVKKLRKGIDDIANNMEAADPVYLQGFVDDLLELLP
jgi:hypothetical protein